jgi:Bacterial Ig domain
MQAPVSPRTVVSNVMSGLLTWVGLAPSLANTPVVPAPSPTMLMALVAVRRELQQALEQQSPTVAYAAAQTSQTYPGQLDSLLGLSNQPPTVNYDPADNLQDAQGVVTGDINPSDAEGDALNYTITQAPQHGDVVVHADGSFTYTPDADFAHTGGTDTFTVRVADDAGLLVSVLRVLNPDFHTARPWWS